MNTSKAASFRDASGEFCCPRCGTPLLQQAVFCSSCGERLDTKKALSSLLQNEQDITMRYRITSLVRGRPFVNLYFAFDNHQSQDQQHMVAIRDFDINSLDVEDRVQAIKYVQQEYDSLRLWHLPYVLPMIDLWYFQGHIYAISGYPFATFNLHSTKKSMRTKVLTGNMRPMFSLQDFLQSGQGLPSEQQALKWIDDLCHALDGLHKHRIVIGELDPHTIVLNKNSTNAELALLISWLPSQLQKLLHPSELEVSSIPGSSFRAPESVEGQAEARSDIYSLGAILYLLLTGSLPSEKALRAKAKLRSPHEMNSHVSDHVSECVMQALATEPSKRFQSTLEMSEALSNPRFSRVQILKNSENSTPAVASDEVAETIPFVPLSQKRQESGQASHEVAPASNLMPLRPLASEAIVELERTEANQTNGQQPASTLEKPQENVTTDSETNAEETNVSAQSSTNTEETPDNISQNGSSTSWLKKLQSLMLSKQHLAMAAAAIIESPQSVQPDQVFTLRIHIMGRDEPTIPWEVKELKQAQGLRKCVHGNTVSVEVRRVFNQNYTFVVQQATATIPSEGYVAELTLPIKPLSSLPNGMQQRLLIDFLDKQRRPLYEKPFEVEVFVSHIVKGGHEGHQVLTIPQ